MGKYRVVQIFTYEQALAHREINDINKLGINDYEDAFGEFFSRSLKYFNGIPARKRYLHLKENEWRFNHRDRSRYSVLLKLLSECPL